MSRRKETMDGNEAAAYVSYAFTEVATIYPITPSSPMAEQVDTWSANGKKNFFGQTVKLVELESECGAAGSMHGALESGALATSYTASQGLLLMVPAMFRMAGALHPGVLHVSSRTVGTHAMSICGDHSDVMAARQTGWALLNSGSVQEVMDLAGIAHLAAIEGCVPFLHFFDGYRTSHEIQKIEVMEYEELKPLLNMEALKKFKKKSMNPEHPDLRNTVQNFDIYFQTKEASNQYYDKLPGIVEHYMNKINQITGRDYKLFNYYGHPEAEHVLIAMGSVSGTIKEVVDDLMARGEKVGFLQVHLYRPFSIKHLLHEMPASVKRIAVLDRTKELGAPGDPLYLDVCSAYVNHENAPEIYTGRYGLSSKNTTPDQIYAVFKNLENKEVKNYFTIGINDDVTHHSLPVYKYYIKDPRTVNCKLWGLGSDGTVGANKNSIKIIGDNTDQYVQAYFEYDTKKSGGITKSNLRFGSDEIRSSYCIGYADFVACHNPTYIDKYEIVQELRPNGTFLLNCSWTGEELAERLPNQVKRYIAQNNISFYTVDAIKIALELGLGNRINTILQSAFFKLADIIPFEDAEKYMKEAAFKSYATKGNRIIKMNYAAIEQGYQGLIKVDVPEDWADLPDVSFPEQDDLPSYIKNIQNPSNAQKGDLIPVSAFLPYANGTVPLGSSKYEKRGIAIEVPVWNPDNCIQCNQCSFVCPHASIRPFLLSEAEMQSAPDSFKSIPAKGKNMKGLYFRIQIDPLDCTGCSTCVITCPAKENALTLEPLESQLSEMGNWEYALSLSAKKNPLDKFSLKGSQFEEPLLEFSGACAGCGETPYAKLLTQLFGDRIFMANGTGCTQAWGAASPTVPYTTNRDGYGPTWSNSLFENNAEFAYGMFLAVKQHREAISMRLNQLIAGDQVPAEAKEAFKEWLDNMEKGDQTRERSDAVLNALRNLNPADDELKEARDYILENKENLTKKTIWMYGGDGWAYDIGYGGLDHILSLNEDVNVLVVDTEVYSNTGGQSSKATPIGAVAQFAAGGKRTYKKDLGLLAMTYGYIYVAQVALGANMNQLVKVIKEAEAYPGPSLIIAYAPCISHGIKSGMGCAQEEAKKAVESGYWTLYHYNPELKKEGKNPFVLDSKKPSASYKDFVMGEERYSSLFKTFPEVGDELLKKAELYAKEKYDNYKYMADKTE